MKNNPKIEKIRHSLAHLLAMAVLEFNPNAKLGIGPTIENGFYYDFETKKPLTEKEFLQLENKIKKLIKQNLKFERKEISKQEALDLFQQKNQPYKIELIKELTEAPTIYITGNFTDLCAGPHIDSTKEINPDAFKLTRVAGAYWRGSEKNPMLTRIYGVAFETKKELDEYLKLQQEAARRDHRILGDKLDLFMIDEKIGKGLPLWLPKGYFIRHQLENYIYNLEKENGYLHVLTPILAKEELYKTSGHLAHYKDDMYSPIEIEGEKFYLRPMNCPHHHSIYSHKIRSYRDLPLRIAEFGSVFRFERSGVLTGMIRARGFTQNDAHIYATQDQLEPEIKSILKLHKKVFKDFKISDYWYRISLPDFNNKEKFGDVENKQIWDQGSEVIKKVLNSLKVNFVEAIGEASFYGPKIDIQIKNIHGKEDTVATIQVDYYSANKFNLAYTDKDGTGKKPVVIHRAIFGSFERFFALLLEKTAGALPLWLTPEQIWVLPIGKSHKKYASQIVKELKENNTRAILKDQDETVGKKIREGELQKIPYLLIVGDKEVKSKSVAVRKRDKGDLGAIKLKKFLEKIKKEI